MKNTIKLWGIIAFVVVIGFTMGCKNDDGPGKDNRSGTLKIVNNSSNPISKIEMRNAEYDETYTQRNWSYTYSTAIAAGETKDIQLTWPDSLENSTGFLIVISEDFSFSRGARLQNGKTTTVTVDSESWKSGDPQ